MQSWIRDLIDLKTQISVLQILSEMNKVARQVEFSYLLVITLSILASSCPNACARGVRVPCRAPCRVWCMDV
jgi:hypothetical protein